MCKWYKHKIKDINFQIGLKNPNYMLFMRNPTSTKKYRVVKSKVGEKNVCKIQAKENWKGYMNNRQSKTQSKDFHQE